MILCCLSFHRLFQCIFLNAGDTYSTFNRSTMCQPRILVLSDGTAILNANSQWHQRQVALFLANPYTQVLTSHSSTVLSLPCLQAPDPTVTPLSPVVFISKVNESVHIYISNSSLYEDLNDLVLNVLRKHSRPSCWYAVH